MKIHASKILVATAVALNAWMLLWGVRYADASGRLVEDYRMIAHESALIPYIPELGAKGNTDYIKQVSKQRSEMADYARSDLDDAHAGAKNAEFMLTTVSGWVGGVMSLVALGLFANRYRVTIDRRSTKVGDANAVPGEVPS